MYTPIGKGVGDFDFLFFFIVMEPVIYNIFVDAKVIFGFIYYESKFPKAFLFMNIVLITMEFIIPVSVVLTGTILICIKLYTGNSMIKNNSSSISRRKAEISNSITRTLLVTDLAFIVLQAPYAILTIMFSIIDDNLLSPETIIFSLYLSALLSQLNSAVNFYLYVFSGARFRQEVKKILCRCRINAKYRND